MGAMDLEQLICRAMLVPVQSGPAHAAHITALGNLAGRLSASRLQLAVLGQFKRGKSSLLNALLGRAVMPIGVLPATSVPVFISDGAGLLLRVIHRSGTVEELHPRDDGALHDALAARVTEEGNPANRLQIARVEVELPAAVLQQGVVLIDTPGVGSTFLHNTTAAEAVLPECDAALFVVSPDPPITATELAYLKQIRKVAASLIVVLNKIDLVGPEERDRSLLFLRRVLAEQAGLAEEMPLFPLSARAALSEGTAKRSVGAGESGLAHLERYLVDVLAKEKARILYPAIAVKAASHIGAMRLETEIVLRSLRMPIEDLERRMAIFDHSIAGIDEEQRDTDDRITGDRVRMLADLDARAGEIERRAWARLLPELAGPREDEPPEALGARLASDAASFFEHAHDAVWKEAQNRLAELMRTHWQRADRLADAVRRAAAELMEVRAAPSLTSDVLPPTHKPYWVSSGGTESLGQISVNLAVRLLPEALRRRRQRRKLEAELATIIKRNVENMRWATRQAIEEALRRLAADISAYLAAVRTATRGAMQAALERRRQQTEASEQEINEQDSVARSLAEIEAAVRQTAKTAAPFA